MHSKIQVSTSCSYLAAMQPLILCSHELKCFLTKFLHDWKKSEGEQYSMMWNLFKIQISVSVSEVLLEHSHTTVYDFICVAMADLSDWSRGNMVLKAWIIWYLELYKNTLPIFAINHFVKGRWEREYLLGANASSYKLLITETENAFLQWKATGSHCFTNYWNLASLIQSWPDTRHHEVLASTSRVLVAHVWEF
jgi:hypothetical protein